MIISIIVTTNDHISNDERDMIRAQRILSGKASPHESNMDDDDVDNIMMVMVIMLWWIPFGGHPLQSEWYREDKHGTRARMTLTSREV